MQCKSFPQRGEKTNIIWNHHVIVMEYNGNITSGERLSYISTWCRNFHTVDGRIPAPPGMYKTLQTVGEINHLSTGAGVYSINSTSPIPHVSHTSSPQKLGRDTTNQRLSLATLVCVSLAHPPNLQSETLQLLTLQETNISHHWKCQIIFKSASGWDTVC